MPVVLVHEGVTQEQYEESVRKLAGKERMESPADWPVPGLLAHIPGQGEKAFGSSTSGNQRRRSMRSPPS